MAVCNVERFLPEAIESVLAQTFTDFELIVIDFGSTDSSKAIVSGYAAKDGRIKLHEISNCGLAEARNAACSHVTAPYIAVMDADDICLPDRLRWEVEFMEKNPNVGLLGGATDWIDAAGRSLGLHNFPTEDREIKVALETHFPFCHPTMLIRQTAFTAVGGYRNAFVFAHDYDLGVRVAERFCCANLKQLVLKYRIHPYQISLRKQQQQTLCRLAAQASVSFRRSGKLDPLDAADQITPRTLVALGVPEARQRRILAADGRNWIRSMTAAGEYRAALSAASDMLKSDRADIEAWQIADLQLTVAQLHWKQGEFLKAIGAAGRAVVTRPLIVGRPIKGLLRRVHRGSSN
jgi:glycosyltransferase involved in cell wall biosynthesis